MEFTTAENLLRAQNDAILVGVFKDNSLTSSAKALDTLTGGQIKQVLDLGDFKAKPGETLNIFHPKNLPANTRVILVGLDDPEKMDEQQYAKILRGCANAIKNSKAQKIACFIPEISIGKRNGYWKVRQAVEILSHALYVFETFKGKKPDAQNPIDQTVIFPAEEFTKHQAELAIQHGKAIAKSVTFTRDLANTPPNVCNPEYLADTARKVAKEIGKLNVHVLSEEEMNNFNMGAFLAVSQGSEESAKLVVIEYNGGEKNQAPIALVGKGITFDTGGLSLKQPTSMIGMKYDMCGAASVLAAIKMAATLHLPINIVAFMACAENMPDGKATRPDDIVTTMSGKTVEIANTDAEGRLVLCDTLTYAQRYQPELIIDVATLTGACIVALGAHASGLLSNKQTLADEILAAGQHSLDRAWQLPLWQEYQPQIDSPVADMVNVGGPEAGTITAACFLSRFTEEVSWAHLDVAGTAFKTGKEASSSGRPVPLLCEFLLRRADVIPA